jgi:TolA-binding protein
MSHEQKDFIINIKFYRILLISIILSPLIIINSNNALNKRNQEKLNKEADIKFKKLIYGRHLDENFQEGMYEICNKTSDELKNYYINKAIEKFDKAVKTENTGDDNPEYIDALIDIIKENTDGESEKALADNAKTYGMHMLGVAIFLVIAILSIPGWFVCCSCCCCNCCCCCCCKKKACKTPFFIFTTILYLLVIAVSIFGLIKSNSIFKGLSDTECSILQFCNEVIEGESIDQKPKWVGIQGINDLLNNVVGKITDLGETTLNNLRAQKNAIKTEQDAFELLMQTNSGLLANDNAGNTKAIDSDSTGTSFNYKLDITTKEVYGLFNAGERKASSDASFMGIWFKQYSLTAENSEKYIGEATDQFTTVLEGNDVTGSIAEVQSSINEIGDSMNEIKDGIASSIVDSSNYIDEYGKLGFKVFFAVLIVIDGFIAILMFLLCFFSGKLCNNCCLCRCFFKFFLHLLWNIFALFMIITFFIGFTFSFLGILGEDLISVVKYFISKSNLDKENPTLFGEAGKKLNVCFNEDGNILDELDINLDDIQTFDQLKTINTQIQETNDKFKELKNQEGVYGEMMDQLKERADYTSTEFEVISKDASANPVSYKLSSLMSQLNTGLTGEIWSFNCEQAASGSNCRNPKDTDVSAVYTTGDKNKIGKKIDAITSLVKIENNGDEANHPNNFKSLTSSLKSKYDTFLDAQLGALNIFNETIKDLTGLFDDYIGENGGVFDFVNCKFIGKNINVILSNLKDCLGGDLYTVGVCLLIAGCAMALSIIFTILLITIINSAVEENKQKEPTS